MLSKLKNILQKNKLVTLLYNKFNHIKINLNTNSPISLHKHTIKNYNKTRTPIIIKSICNAPFTSLHIGIDGKYRVCCYNREFFLGDVFENTLSEIWFGDKIKILRAKLEKFDFSAGCYACKVQFEQKAFQTVLAKNFDEFNNISKKYPQIIEFELSNTCNLECVMCSGVYSSKIEQKFKSQDEFKLKFDENKLLKELVEFIPHLKKAKFSGGEPFLIRSYYKIWKLLNKLNPNCEITIQTNGTILNEEIKSTLLQGNFNLIISVDSLIKQSFDQIRINGNFENFYTNLLWFIDFCKKEKRYIGITTCVMRQNWKEIPNIIKLCNKKEISITFNRVWDPPNCAIWGSSYSYISKVLDFFEQINLPSDNYKEYNNLKAFNDIKNLVKQWQIEAKSNEEFQLKYGSLAVEKLEDIINNKLNTIPLDESKKNVLQTMQLSLQQYRTCSNYKKLLIELIKIPEEILIRELKNNSQSQLNQQIQNYLNKTAD